MRCALVLAVSIGWTGVSQAGWCDYSVPPEEYRKTPTVEYAVYKVPPDLLHMFCDAEDAPLGLLGGCVSRESETWWHVYVRSDVSAAEQECILTHEFAHLPPNQWRHNPTYAAYMIDGQWRPKPGPKYRRAVHIRPWDFAKARGSYRQ